LDLWIVIDAATGNIPDPPNVGSNIIAEGQSPACRRFYDTKFPPPTN